MYYGICNTEQKILIINDVIPPLLLSEIANTMFQPTFMGNFTIIYEHNVAIWHVLWNMFHADGNFNNN